MTARVNKGKINLPIYMNILKNKKLLVFTGGGLAPALNPTLYGVIREAQRHQMKIFGGLFGWACLLRNGKAIDLTHFNPLPLKDVGGTFLRSSRTNPLGISDGLDIVKEKLREYGVDFVVAIGGDDTLGAANALFNKEKIKIVGIPKTIDNDLQGTYYTPGFPTAAYYTAKFCEEIKMDAAYALSRIFIIEVLGRKSGWLAASGAFGAADVIIPPEREVKLSRVLNLLAQRYEKNGNFATLVISEETNFDQEIQGLEQDQKDSFNIKRKSFIALGLKEKIKKELGIDCKPLFPGNFLQTGSPIKFDADFADKLGMGSINLIKQEKFGFMTALKRVGKSLRLEVIETPLAKAVGKVKLLDDTYFDFENFKVKNKFYNYMKPIFNKHEFDRKWSYLKVISQMQKYVR